MESYSCFSDILSPFYGISVKIGTFICFATVYGLEVLILSPEMW